MAAVQNCLLAILATAAYAQSEALMGVALVETNPHKNLRSGAQPNQVQQAQQAMAHYKCMIKMKSHLKLPADAKPIQDEESNKMIADLQGDWKITLMEKPENPICPELQNLKTIQYKKAKVKKNIAVLSGGIDSDGKTKRMQTQVLTFTRSKDKTLYIDKFGTKVLKFDKDKGELVFRNALGYTIYWERDHTKSVEADAGKADKRDEKKSAEEEKKAVKEEKKADKKETTEKKSAEKNDASSQEKSAKKEETADKKAITEKKSVKKENKAAKEDKSMQKAIHKIEERIEEKSAKKKAAKGEPKVKITEVKITDVQAVEDTKLLVQKESTTVGSGLAPMGVGMMA